MNRKGRKKAVSACLLIVAVILTGWMSVYVGFIYQASDETLIMAHQYPAHEKIRGRDVLFFGPADAENAVIFYPGAKVQYEAYAPLCRKLGEEGILCALVKMPCCLALLDMDIADDIKDYCEQNYDCRNFYLAGHSLGGAIVCEKLYKDASGFRGIVLLGAFSSKDLSTSDFGILSIYGFEDDILSDKKMEQSAAYMTSSFTEKVIEGGCHSYFGDYGMQKDDGIPTVTREEQMQITADTIAEWLQK